MPATDDDDRRILTLAVSRKMLTADEAQTLLNLADETNDSICDLAIRRDLLSAADIDSLRPLTSPTSYLNDYEFVDLVGQGAAGTVYKARQVRLNRIVAIKLLKQSALENQTATARSQIEAQLGARMQHPNIAAVYDYGVEHGRIYLAMEYIEGRSLLEQIEAHGPIDERVAVQLIQQVMNALSHAAANDVIHRDIKPANLVLTNDLTQLNMASDVPAVKVLDFGLAFEGRNEDATRLTADGAALGTPCYVAPEQLTNSTVDIRADIYGLGATLFHMVTGTQPFCGENAFQAMAAKMRGNEDWRNKLDGVSDPVRHLILDMTHHDVDARIADYGMLAKRLAQLLNPDAAPSTLSRFSGSTTANSRRKRTRLLSLVAAVVLMAAAIGGYVVWSDQAVPTRIEVETVSGHSLFTGLESPTKGVGRGTWRAATDLEGGYVLAGTTGWLRFKESARPLAHPGFYHFEVGVNPLGNAAADICFGIQQSGACKIIRLQNGVARFGSGRMGSDEFVADKATAPIELQQGTDGPAYQSVRIEHQSAGWFITVIGEPLAAVSADEDDRPDFVLSAEKGTVHFESIQFVENQPVPE